MKKIWVVIVLLLAGITGQTAVAASDAKFQDIQGHWAQSAIERMVEAGAINGYPDDTFKPNGTITRAEFSSILGGLMNVTGGSEAFADTKGHWAAPIINGLVHAGVIVPAEYLNGFGPNDHLTRLEMSKMIARGLAQGSTEWTQVLEGLQQITYMNLPFTDKGELDKDDMPYIALANGSGIVNGYNNGTFGSDRLATRAEAVVMLSRFVKLKEEVPDPASFIEKFTGHPTILDLLSNPKLKLEKAASLPSDYHGMDQILWDGEKYIALGVAENVPHVFTSTNGVDWTSQAIPVFGLSHVAFSDDRYMAVGNLTPVGNSAVITLYDSDGNPILHDGNGRNVIEAGNRNVQVNAAASSDGIEWEAISGHHEPGAGGSSWQPDIFFVEKDGKFVLLTSSKVFFSLNGADFAIEQEIYVSDPQNLTPAGYIYLGSDGSITPGDQKLAYDGEYYYNTTTDYFGFGIVRSKDFVQWDFVYFEARTNFNEQIFLDHKIFINDGKYFVLNGNTIVSSVDGENWISEPFQQKDLFIQENDMSSSGAFYYHGYYFMQSIPSDAGSNHPEYHSIYATKDFKQFIEIKVEDFNGVIRFIDDRFIFTSIGVYMVNE